MLLKLGTVLSIVVLWIPSVICCLYPGMPVFGLVSSICYFILCLAFTGINGYQRSKAYLIILSILTIVLFIIPVVISVTNSTTLALVGFLAYAPLFPIGYYAGYIFALNVDDLCLIVIITFAVLQFAIYFIFLLIGKRRGKANEK